MICEKPLGLLGILYDALVTIFFAIENTIQKLQIEKAIDGKHYYGFPTWGAVFYCNVFLHIYNCKK